MPSIVKCVPRKRVNEATRSEYCKPGGPLKKLGGGGVGWGIFEPHGYFFVIIFLV